MWQEPWKSTLVHFLSYWIKMLSWGKWVQILFLNTMSWEYNKRVKCFGPCPSLWLFASFSFFFFLPSIWSMPHQIFIYCQILLTNLKFCDLTWKHIIQPNLSLSANVMWNKTKLAPCSLKLHIISKINDYQFCSQLFFMGSFYTKIGEWNRFWCKKWDELIIKH